MSHQRSSYDASSLSMTSIEFCVIERASEEYSSIPHLELIFQWHNNLIYHGLPE
jgi:hypothetical protein